MFYLYANNVNPRDRFTRFEMRLDGGATIFMLRGRVYDLSTTELARAQKFIELRHATELEAAVYGIVYLPVQGEPVDGDVPIWSSSSQAFALGYFSGGTEIPPDEPPDEPPTVTLRLYAPGLLGISMRRIVV